MGENDSCWSLEPGDLVVYGGGLTFWRDAGGWLVRDGSVIVHALSYPPGGQAGLYKGKLSKIP